MYKLNISWTNTRTLEKQVQGEYKVVFRNNIYTENIPWESQICCRKSERICWSKVFERKKILMQKTVKSTELFTVICKVHIKAISWKPYLYSFFNCQTMIVTFPLKDWWCQKFDIKVSLCYLDIYNNIVVYRF